MDNSKTIIDTIRALKDANISHEAGREQDEDTIGGVPTKLTSDHSKKVPKKVSPKENVDNFVKEYTDSLKQLFTEPKDV